MRRGVIYVQGSSNSKLEGSKPIDATYAPIGYTCSKTCPLKADKLCYATLSYVGIINRRLERRSRGMSPRALARLEAKCIDNSYKGGAVPAGRMLRIHVSGDARQRASAKILAKSADRWLNRGGEAVFSYTHSWKNVPRSDWGRVSVLASIENVSQVEEARKQGYAPALVISEFPSEKAFTLQGSDVSFIPCPAQSKPGGKEVHCSDCRLCMRSNWLYENKKGISFSAHGVRKNLLKRSLAVIQ